MTQNMGLIDRILRALAASVVAGLYMTGTIGGTSALLLGIFALVFLLTSFTGTCPLYAPLDFSTRGSTRT